MAWNPHVGSSRSSWWQWRPIQGVEAAETQEPLQTRSNHLCLMDPCLGQYSTASSRPSLVTTIGYPARRSHICSPYCRERQPTFYSVSARVTYKDITGAQKGPVWTPLASSGLLGATQSQNPADWQVTTRECTTLLSCLWSSSRVRLSTHSDTTEDRELKQHFIMDVDR
jgi:hypothetical protein